MILELGHYALSVSRSKPRWRTENAVELPRGETVDSIVSLAFEKVLSGERHWEPQKEPDLKRYLMGVIDSLLSHLARHQDNRVLAALPDLENSASGGVSPHEQAGSSAGPWHTQPLYNPETVLLQKEQHEHQQQGLQLLAEAAQDDPTVAQIIQAMRQGHHKAGEIATVLGIAVTEVYNAMKRLDRKIVRVRQQVVETLAST
jgi:DNA-directed RNA polymerase specialized sigma24 family protein